MNDSLQLFMNFSVIHFFSHILISSDLNRKLCKMLKDAMKIFNALKDMIGKLQCAFHFSFLLFMGKLLGGD